MTAAGSPAPGASLRSPLRFALATLAAMAGLGITGLVVLLLVASPLCACTPPRPSTSTAALPPSPIVGVVVRVDSAGLGQVRGFDLRLEDGSTVTLTLGPLENAAEFSPSHLTEHQASSEPVRAFYRLETSVPVVYRLEDAPRA